MRHILRASVRLQGMVLESVLTKVLSLQVSQHLQTATTAKHSLSFHLFFFSTHSSIAHHPLSPPLSPFLVLSPHFNLLRSSPLLSPSSIPLILSSLLLLCLLRSFPLLVLSPRSLPSPPPLISSPFFYPSHSLLSPLLRSDTLFGG